MADLVDTADRPRTLFLIDAPGFIFRAFHALPPLSTSGGQPTGAAYGFCTMLLRLIDEYQPDLLAAVFERGRSFRQRIYPEYKANRPPRPAELESQFPLVRQLLSAFRVPIVELPDFEADDVIATLAVRARAAGLDVMIVSSDKDLMQLADEHVQLLDTMKDKCFGPADVQQKFGVPPPQLADWLALVGDSSDNIPGVDGVGAKTASKLLLQFGSLEGVLAAANQVKAKRLRENLLAQADRARQSRRLVELRRDCPLEQGLEDLRRQQPDGARLWQMLGELEFGRLRQRLAPASELACDSYLTVTTTAQLEEVVAQVRRAGRLSLALQTTDGTSRSPLVGIALCWSPDAACYLPLGHSYLGVPRQLSWADVRAMLAPLLQDTTVARSCFDGKLAQVVLALSDTVLGPWSDDPMLASYLLDPSRSHQLSDLALDQLGHKMVVPPGTGQRAKFGEMPVQEATAQLAERAEVTLRLTAGLQQTLDQQQLAWIYREIELPLSTILAGMELRGCLIDRAPLQDLSGELARELLRLERDIQHQAGWEVNVGSPKQLQKLLFEQLGLSTGRKTKSGFSTDADVLADLALEHPIAAQIQEHRVLAKLKGTYLDALPALIDRRTGRLHTSYNQAVAATGRLSSSDPNLQNIPIRTELGRRIRAAFVAPPGRVLLSADYSQIELRVLAHMSGDALLLDAFRRRQDVHARTAAEVFGVEPESVTAEQRRVAKAVNFGVIYGQTDFGLARQLHISRAEARAYIEGYFERYAGVRSFMDSVVAQARESGSVRTLFGRRRPVADINSRRYQARSAAERIARNTPIQGTAADLIKLAMIRTEVALAARGLDAPMILTVHDELVFEVVEAEVEVVRDLVRETMAEVASLEVPLEVEVSWGRSWAEAH